MLTDELHHLKDLFQEGKLFDMAAEEIQLILALIYEHFWTIVALTLLSFLISKLSQKYQNKGIKLYFSPESSVFNDLLKETKLSKMVSNQYNFRKRYKPNMFALNGHVQAVLSTLTELLYAFMNWNLEITEREIFKTSDGGSLLLAWYKEGAKSNRKLLVILPGLSGTQESLYCQSLVKEANNRGYDSVVVNYVGMAGVELTVSRT